MRAVRARAAAPRAAARSCSLAMPRRPPANDLPDAGVSPQAKAEPAQLENVAVASSAHPLTPDAGPPPVPLRGDEAAPPDS